MPECGPQGRRHLFGAVPHWPWPAQQDPSRSLRRPHRLSALTCDATAFRLSTPRPVKAHQRRSGQAAACVALFNSEAGLLPVCWVVSAAFAHEPARWKPTPRTVDLTPIKLSDGDRDHHPGACAAVGAWVEWAVEALEAEAPLARAPRIL